MTTEELEPWLQVFLQEQQLEEDRQQRLMARIQELRRPLWTDLPCPSCKGREVVFGHTSGPRVGAGDEFLAFVCMKCNARHIYKTTDWNKYLQTSSDQMGLAVSVYLEASEKGWWSEPCTTERCPQLDS